VWRVKLVAELQPGVTTETEVARIERDEEASLAELGLRLEEAKQLTATLQAQIVPAQVASLGECRRSCVSCGSVLVSKGHYPVRFRSLFGDVPLRIRRLLICPCQGGGEVKSFAVLNLGRNPVAPEFAYITARYAALAPFGKVAAFLSELLPMSRPQNAGTVGVVARIDGWVVPTPSPSEVMQYGQRLGVPGPACDSRHGQQRQIRWRGDRLCESADHHR
jgi:hypothetical protein